MAGKFRSMMAKYAEVELLLRIGEYKKGADALADEAIAKIDRINGFLRQDTHDLGAFEDTMNLLRKVVS